MAYLLDAHGCIGSDGEGVRVDQQEVSAVDIDDIAAEEVAQFVEDGLLACEQRGMSANRIERTEGREENTGKGWKRHKQKLVYIQGGGSVRFLISSKKFRQVNSQPANTLKQSDSAVSCNPIIPQEHHRNRWTHRMIAHPSSS